jgi:phage shock protein PspC (stress-responsive transcriptional regulator)
MYRNSNDKIIAGVCAGIAKSLDCDPFAIRIAFMLAFVLYGMGPLLYIVLWILMKPEGGA